MAQEYKETLEWQALTKIWRAIEPAKREGLMEEFRLLTDWIKRDMELSKPAAEQETEEGGAESGFLRAFSSKVKMLVLTRLTAGQGNLYDECKALAQAGGTEDALWSKFCAAHPGDAALERSEAEIREILRHCAGRA